MGKGPEQPALVDLALSRGLDQMTSRHPFQNIFFPWFNSEVFVFKLFKLFYAILQLINP